METPEVYVTPKRKFNHNTTCSPSDTSPVEKRAKESNSPDATSPGDEDQVMAALNLSEGVAKKFDLILAKLCSLDSKMEDLNTTVKSLQSKLSFVEIDIDSVKDKQKNLDEKFTHMETNSKFVDERINQLQSSLEKSKKEVDECHQKILYLEAYSRNSKELQKLPRTMQLQLEVRTLKTSSWAFLKTYSELRTPRTSNSSGYTG